MDYYDNALDVDAFYLRYVLLKFVHRRKVSVAYAAAAHSNSM